MTRFLLLSLILVLVGCDCDDTDLVQNLVDSDLDIILVIGQSNTHSGLGLDPTIDIPHDKVFQLGRFGADNNFVIAANEPLQHHTQHSGRIGFALSFSKQYVTEFLPVDGIRNVAIIPGGAGGTGFGGNRWNKGDDLYEDAVQRTQFIKNNFENSRLVAILWHQGEADVGLPDYQQRLDQFIFDIRQDLDAEDVPFILGGMVPFWVDSAPDRSTQQNIISGTVNRVDGTGYADPNQPFVIQKPDNTYDDIHFDASGQREIARRYFWEFERLIE